MVMGWAPAEDYGSVGLALSARISWVSGPWCRCRMPAIFPSELAVAEATMLTGLSSATQRRTQAIAALDGARQRALPARPEQENTEDRDHPSSGGAVPPSPRPP